jgi:dual specificity phosphatase 12
MLDHGQLGPATPTATTPADSRRPSFAGQSSRSQNGSFGAEVTRKAPRKSFNGVLGESLSMSAIHEDPGKDISSPILDLPSPSTSQVPTPRSTPSTPYGHPLHSLRSMSHALLDPSSMSALEIEDDGDDDSKPTEPSESSPEMSIDLTGTTAEDISIHASQLLGRRLSDAVISSASDTNPLPENRTGSYFRADGSAVTEHSPDAPEAPVETPTTHLISPSDLAAQLMSDPKLAALRSPPVSVTTPQGSASKPVPISAPILVNPKCSGYFVEPVSQTFLLITIFSSIDFFFTCR